jgi:hypothetical protein
MVATILGMMVFVESSAFVRCCAMGIFPQPSSGRTAGVATTRPVLRR